MVDCINRQVRECNFRAIEINEHTDITARIALIDDGFANHLAVDFKREAAAILDDLEGVDAVGSVSFVKFAAEVLAPEAGPGISLAAVILIEPVFAVTAWCIDDLKAVEGADTFSCLIIAEDHAEGVDR